MAMPTKVKYVIIGAGIHGLSTAWHLAARLQAQGKGGGQDILVVDKGSIGAGASGIACGVVRNNYFQPAMRELMAQCVEVWESDKEAFSYHPVGYMQISPEVMHGDVARIAAEVLETFDVNARVLRARSPFGRLVARVTVLDVVP